MKITITKEAAEILGVTDLVVMAEDVRFLKESNAIEGVYDYDSLMQAVYAWSFLKRQKKLDRGVILKTHKILMLHQPLRPDEKGYFRKIQVWVGGREGIAWYMIPDAIENWIINANIYPMNSKRHHVEFEKIHPFVDGNGRLGRMLMNWERLKNKQKVLIIKDAEKQKYYKWFSSN